MKKFNFHSKEFLFRLLYLLGAWTLTSILVYLKYEELIFAYSPGLPTIIIYNSGLEVFTTRITFSIVTAFLLILPHIINMLRLYIRAGMYERDSKDFGRYMVIKFAIGPWFYYTILIEVYTQFILHFSDNSFIRYLPTLLTINQQMISLMLISIILTISPDIIRLGIKKKEYIKNRFGIWYFMILFLSLILPPDIFSLFLGFILTFLGLEFWHFLQIFQTCSLPPSCSIRSL